MSLLELLHFGVTIIAFITALLAYRKSNETLLRHLDLDVRESERTKSLGEHCSDLWLAIGELREKQQEQESQRKIIRHSGDPEPPTSPIKSVSGCFTPPT